MKYSPFYKHSLVVFIALFSVFLFLLFMLVASFLSMSSSAPTPLLLGVFVEFHVQFMVLLGVLGVGVGVCSYYVFSAHTRSLQDSYVLSKDILFRFLDSDERRVIRALVGDELVTQAEVSRMRDMGKVRAYRTVKKLEDKGVIFTEPHGRTKRLVLDSELAAVLK